MIAHLLNPEFDFLRQAPNLFFAGYLLSFLYLKFNNIWLPLGFHFANNISNDIFEQLSGLKIDNNSFFSHRKVI